MENYELANVVEAEMVDLQNVGNEGTGISAGAAAAAGAGAVIAIIAAVKLGQKLYAWIKDKKGPRQPDREIEVTDEDIERVVSK